MMNPISSIITVTKHKYGKNEPFSYQGKVLEFDGECLVIEAYFNRDDFPFHGVVLKRNDRFIETYYTRRWYNIFEIHDREDDSLKCWYCNVAEPAVIEDGAVSFVDLALDLLVYTNRRKLVLDEDEFDALHLSPELTETALAALEELKRTCFDVWKPK
jgi:uncharacterized protein